MEVIKEQEVFFLMAIAISLLLALAIAFVFFYSQSQKRILREEVKGQELLLQNTIIAQEEERSRIAKDLHDEIGSKLNVIFLHAQRFKNIGIDHNKRLEISDDLTDIVNQAIDSTRRIAHDLLPPTLEEFGLIVALEELSDAYFATDSLEIHIFCESDELNVSNKMVELNLFRIIQELLNNSLKHGRAQHVNIRLSSTLGHIRILYEDDGKGFNTNSAHPNKGLGMKSIESRLRIINGNWTYQSTPGKGLKTSLSVNLNS